VSGFWVSASALGSTLGLALVLWLARRVGDRLGSDEPPLWRSLLWLGVTLAGLAAMFVLQTGWVLTGAGFSVTAWSLLGAALDERGGALRRRLALLQLYLALFGAAYLYARGRGVLDGGRASTAFAFALHDQLAQLALPLAEGVSRHADPAWAVHAVANGLSRHLLLWLTLASFAFAAYAGAYLSQRPLPLPGAGLLPAPRAFAAGFALLGLASELVPSAHPVGRGVELLMLALCPLFVVDGGAVLHRWLGRLRSRALVLGLLGALALFAPLLVVAFAVLGVLVQLGGLRELLPFAALDEAPLERPRLSALLVAMIASALCMAALTAGAQVVLERRSPRLGAPTEVCGGVEPGVDWVARTATFQLRDASFGMDLDETPVPTGTRPAEACERAGKRVCTSDEWYLACACTYPLEVEPGRKTSTNYAFVARAERERAAGAPPPREPTVAADKRSEVRGLITGRSEIVAQASAKSLLLAGPNDALRDPWTVDCRHRSFLTPAALSSALGDLAAVRCCR